MVKRIFLLSALFALLSDTANAFVSGGSLQPIAFTVTADTSANLGGVIPSNFVGWSEEVLDLVNYGYFTGSTGTSFLGVASLLGVNGQIRIGGSNSDGSTAPALTQTIANQLASFVTSMGAGWTLVYDLDAVANNTTLANTQIGYFVTAFGNQTTTSVEIGNEPPENGLNQSTFTTIWNSYYSSIHTSYSSLQFVAPSILDNEPVVQSYVDGMTPGESGMSLIETHFYAYCNQAPPSIYALTYAPVIGPNANWAYNTSWASGKQRMMETNTICGGGYLGYSNTMMESPWFISLTKVLLDNAWIGVNPHEVMGNNPLFSGNRPAYYNPFLLQSDGNVSPGPEFYAMLLVSKIEGNQRIDLSVPPIRPEITTIAVKNGGGLATILISNGVTSQSIVVTPQQKQSWATASVLLLGSTSNVCTDTTAVLGGQTIGESGVWTGAPFTITNGQTVTIPPCGAALIQITS